MPAAAAAWEASVAGATGFRPTGLSTAFAQSPKLAKEKAQSEQSDLQEVQASGLPSIKDTGTQCCKF